MYFVKSAWRWLNAIHSKKKKEKNPVSCQREIAVPVATYSRKQHNCSGFIYTLSADLYLWVKDRLGINWLIN